jgi:hypothetical protein
MADLYFILPSPYSLAGIFSIIQGRWGDVGGRKV